MNRSFIVLIAGLGTVVWSFLASVTPLTKASPRWYALVGDSPPALLAPAQGSPLPPSAGTHSWRCSVDLPLFRLGFFTPDAALIAQLESDLASFLPFAEQLPIARYTASHRRPLHQYFRQYLGVNLPGRRQLVIINAFASLKGFTQRPTTYWSRRFVDVCDGGAGFWHLEYDPATRRFRRFTFNGFA
jgi:hypothetical protein